MLSFSTFARIHVSLGILNTYMIDHELFCSSAEKTQPSKIGAAFGKRHGVLVLFIISALLVLRGVFLTATATHLADVSIARLPHERAN